MQNILKEDRIPLRQMRQSLNHTDWLFQVLSALDRAQQALGFFHQDMRLDNVMEHRLQEELGDRKPEADETQFGKT
jgi:hypothetical protein